MDNRPPCKSDEKITKADEVAIGIVFGALFLFIIGSICGIIVAVMKFVELVS